MDDVHGHALAVADVDDEQRGDAHRAPVAEFVGLGANQHRPRARLGHIRRRHFNRHAGQRRSEVLGVGGGHVAVVGCLPAALQDVLRNGLVVRHGAGERHFLGGVALVEVHVHLVLQLLHGLEEGYIDLVVLVAASGDRRGCGGGFWLVVVLAVAVVVRLHRDILAVDPLATALAGVLADGLALGEAEHELVDDALAAVVLVGDGVHARLAVHLVGHHDHAAQRAVQDELHRQGPAAVAHRRDLLVERRLASLVEGVAVVAAGEFGEELETLHHRHRGEVGGQGLADPLPLPLRRAHGRHHVQSLHAAGGDGGGASRRRHGMLVDVVGHLLVRQVEVDAVAVEGSDVFLAAVRPSLLDHAEHRHRHCELTGVVGVVVFAPSGDSIGADVAVPAAHLAHRPVQEIGDVALPVDVRAGPPGQQAIDGPVGALGSHAVIVASDRPLAAGVRQHHGAVAKEQFPAAAVLAPRGLGASSQSVAHLKH